MPFTKGRVPSLPPQQQVDSVWRDSNTQVVVISPAVYMAFEVLSKAVQKHTERNFSDGLGWSGSTVNSLRHWLLFLKDEAVTDARAGSHIRLIGPWEEGAPWPEGLPHGGKDAPYTELMRVVAGGRAPCFEDLSRWSTSLLSPFLLSAAWRPDWPYCHWTQPQVRGQAQRMVTKERRQTQGSMCGPPCVCTRAEIRHAHVWLPGSEGGTGRGRHAPLKKHNVALFSSQFFPLRCTSPHRLAVTAKR